MLFLPTCPLAGQSRFGQNSCVEFIGLLLVYATTSLPLSSTFFKPYFQEGLSKKKRAALYGLKKK
jgi:hypothetical protein